MMESLSEVMEVVPRLRTVIKWSGALGILEALAAGGSERTAGDALEMLLRSWEVVSPAVSGGEQARGTLRTGAD